MVAGIRFSIDESTKGLKIEVAASGGDVFYYGKKITPIKIDKPMLFDMKQPLVSLLKSMQERLADILTIYHESGERETFDTAVVSIINGIENSSSSITSDFLSKMMVRKAYARYYYEMFSDRIVTLDREKNKDEFILTSLVSYYFVKRLVHVFVMCTIYEKISSATVSPSGSTTSVIISSNTRPAEPAADFTAERNILEAKVASLEASIRSAETLSSSSSDKMKEIEALNRGLLDNAQEKIRSLENQVNNYRELLLKSTTMIFKLDEIPNVMLGRK
jgi:hypothetical protein